VLTDFVSEVQRSLGYFTNTHRDVQIQYMMGLGNAFRLPGLQRFLSEKLQLDVRKMDKLHRLTGAGVVDAPVFTENVLSFAVAYGLALQGLRRARLLTNLLPQEIRMERLIKGKKPWAVAAAAALLLSIAGLLFGYGSQWYAYGGDPKITKKNPTAADLAKADNPVQKARGRGDQVLNAIRSAQKAFDDAVAAAKKEEDSIGSIVAGQKEQINWLKLCQFIDEAVPRPEDAFPLLGKDGKPLKDTQGKPIYNLPDAALKYVDDAREAYQNEWKPWRQGTPIRIPEGKKDDGLGEGLNRLMQFNIEAVSCRFSDKLSDFWGKLPEKVKDPTRREVLPPEDLKTAPGTTDRGWVIELRGYTFHKDDITFVKDVLMENIVRKAKEKPLSWPLPGEQLAKAENQQGAPPGGAPPGGTQGGGTPGDKPAGPTRAISHVILYNSSLKKEGVFVSTPFEIITTSKVGTVVVASAATPQGNPPGGGAPPPGGGAPPPGGGAPPPGGGSAPPGGGSSPPGGGSAPPGGGAGPPGAPRGGTIHWHPLGTETLDAPGQAGKQVQGMGDKGTTATDAPPAHEYKRTEFVIFFIWREPNPADSLLPLKGTGSPDQQQQGGFPGGNPGGGFPGGQNPGQMR
jgi:hypothetical protein